jgi:hypothetical protein
MRDPPSWPDNAGSVCPVGRTALARARPRQTRRARPAQTSLWACYPSLFACMPCTCEPCLAWCIRFTAAPLLLRTSNQWPRLRPQMPLQPPRPAAWPHGGSARPPAAGKDDMRIGTAATRRRTDSPALGGRGNCLHLANCSLKV